MAEKHALVTGPITGRILTPSGDIPHDTVNVTDDVLYFDDVKIAQAVAYAIEDEQWARDSHPIQEQRRELDSQPDITDEERAQHQSLYEEVRKSFETRTASYGKGVV